MAIEIIKGNLLDAFDKGEVNVIAHCCNMQNTMGTGIAKQIKQRYPQAFIADTEWYSWNKNKPVELFISRATVFDKRIFNLYGQVNYGRTSRHLHYGMLAMALQQMKQALTDYPNLSIGFPMGMGCGNAGGNWQVVYELIEAIFHGMNVKIYQL